MNVNINYTIKQIAGVVKAKWLQKCEDTPLNEISLDSRKIKDPTTALFWPIKTDSGNGHQFIYSLYDSGVRNFIVSEKIQLMRVPSANVIQVPDTLTALQQLATAHRKKFKNIHVIGITGSNGKTVVKEWLHTILSDMFEVVKSPRSYNSQIGVPLSILQMRSHHQVGIFEAGISKPAEMVRLQKMILPNTGVLTNIGTAHAAGFINEKHKLQEKLRLFKGAGAVIFPGGSTLIEHAIDSSIFLDNSKKVSWCNQGCSVRVISIEKKDGHSTIQLATGKKRSTIEIPFIDDASVSNAITCYCVLASAGWITKKTNAAFKHLDPVSMRLEVKPGLNRTSIINDSYSNDLQSLGIAADFLSQQTHRHATAIISDVLQTGLPQQDLYRQVANTFAGKKVDRLICIGPEISKQRKAFSSIRDCHFFPSTDEFVQHLHDFDFHDESILIKGARNFHFEKISKLLEAHLHQTVFSVNLSNLSHNIRTYRTLIKPGTKLMAMVKAFAYGTGAGQIASLLQYVKADYLAVAFTDEGISLRNEGISLPVMVLNVDTGSFENLMTYRLEPEIFSFRLLEDFTRFLRQQNVKSFPVHLKIDTGMHRLGFSGDDIDELIRQVQQNNWIRIRSVFTHLSSSDNPLHDDFTRSQFQLFRKLTGQLKRAIPYHFDCHLSNTSAISRFPDFRMDMVRVGIGMYGVDDSAEMQNKLKMVNQLTTSISQIKTVKAGEVVGYGLHRVKSDKTIAIVGIGYADGYPRLLGNGKGKMLVQGRMVPTIGNICMDMSMLDITGIKNVREGDEVVVFGDRPTVQDVAKWAKTIPYEIFTGISPRVRRVYYDES